MERDCRKEVHTVVVLSNSDGQTAEAHARDNRDGRLRLHRKELEGEA